MFSVCQILTAEFRTLNDFLARQEIQNIHEVNLRTCYATVILSERPIKEIDIIR